MLTNQKNSPFCQVQTIPRMSSGWVDSHPMSPQKRVKFWLKRNLSARTKRRLKRAFDDLVGRIPSSAKEATVETLTSENSPAVPEASSSAGLKAGDTVRVRLRAEIEATLDGWHELKGCVIMPDMWQYCGTTQRVFKVVERFVDERDYRLKKGTGILLLEGLICQGTADYGRCDRACFYFWREEWLETVD